MRALRSSKMALGRMLRSTIVGAVFAAACRTDAPVPTAVIAASNSPAAPADQNDDANWGRRGRLVNAVVLRRLTVQQTLAILGGITPKELVPAAIEAFAPSYDVDHYAIEYTTTDAHGELVVASAGVFVPIAAGVPLPERLPLVSFSHGTQTDKQKVPSTLKFINPQGIIQAAHGSVAVLADYVGMGVDAAHVHPYLVADVGASSSVDALRAASRLVKQLGLSLDGRLFIYGHSQGGQVAMALARELERTPRSGFTATAVAPMAGPYALYEVGKIGLADPTPRAQAAVPMAYLMAAYQETYHLAATLNDLLVSPYDEIGHTIVTAGMTDEQILAAKFPKFAREVLQPAVTDAWLNKPDSPLSRALQANQTYDWRPRAPMRMYYGEADVTVAPLNTAIALERMSALGAPDVQAVKLIGVNGEALAHGATQWPAYIAARRWFNTFPAPAREEEEQERFHEHTYP